MALISDIFLARSRASSKLPSMESTLAPKNMACASLPAATLPDGRKTAHFSPALAAYAARLADVFPVDAHPTIFAPISTAWETPIVIPRSLKDPVGFAPSYFTYRSFIPISFPRAEVL